jgi:hypothetical protein
LPDKMIREMLDSGAEVITMPPGTVLMRAGLKVDSVFVILSGLVNVYLPRKDGPPCPVGVGDIATKALLSACSRGRLIDTLSSGSVVAALSMLSGDPARTDAVARTRARIIRLRQRDVFRLIRSQPAPPGFPFRGVSLLEDALCKMAAVLACEMRPPALFKGLSGSDLRTIFSVSQIVRPLPFRPVRLAGYGIVITGHEIRPSDLTKADQVIKLVADHVDGSLFGISPHFAENVLADMELQQLMQSKEEPAPSALAQAAVKLRSVKTSNWALSPPAVAEDPGAILSAPSAGSVGDEDATTLDEEAMDEAFSRAVPAQIAAESFVPQRDLTIRVPSDAKAASSAAATPLTRTKTPGEIQVRVSSGGSKNDQIRAIRKFTEAAASAAALSLGSGSERHDSESDLSVEHPVVLPTIVAPPLGTPPGGSFSALPVPLDTVPTFEVAPDAAPGTFDIEYARKQAELRAKPVMFHFADGSADFGLGAEAFTTSRESVPLSTDVIGVHAMHESRMHTLNHDPATPRWFSPGTRVLLVPYRVLEFYTSKAQRQAQAVRHEHQAAARLEEHFDKTLRKDAEMQRSSPVNRHRGLFRAVGHLIARLPSMRTLPAQQVPPVDE